MAYKTGTLRGVMMILVIVLGSKCSLACRRRPPGMDGSGEYYTDDDGEGKGSNEDGIFYDWDKMPTIPPFSDQSVEEPLSNLSQIRDAIERNKKIAWGGWTPPPSVEQEWRNWLYNYQMMVNKSDHLSKENQDRLRKDRERDGNWPQSWLDLGHGLGGMEPPPWAYATRYTGKPEACNMAPRTGGCQETLMRWGWNPYLEICMNYTWSGCGGTYNNFVTKLKCEEMCAMPAPPSCDSDSGIPIKDEVKK